MAVKQVDLIRGYVFRKIRELKIFISMLPDREEDALKALSGTEGTKNAAEIADFVLERFGHKAPKVHANYDSVTRKQARALGP